jgi:hypothetical protein
MRIEFIYTFETGQKIETYPFVNAIASSEETLKELATAFLSESEKKSLVKVSCCVYGLDLMILNGIINVMVNCGLNKFKEFKKQGIAIKYSLLYQK